MTQAQAAEIVTAALAASPPQDNILSADAFASRLATALDALGLLDYACSQEQKAAVQMSAAPIDPASGAKAPAPDRIAEGVAWAATRQRT